MDKEFPGAPITNGHFSMQMGKTGIKPLSFWLEDNRSSLSQRYQMRKGGPPRESPRWGNSGFSILPKDTSACRWGRLGIELPTFRLEDDRCTPQPQLPQRGR
ncbi:unnamed protein product [Pleuronectes platessa]|uniref:Uncharacterized protein n=1 Tax=Pleuronectes platessa TaxID=8262 RepID=A0A9N7TZD3_PLEPL|nr:unnamed protein product [Pleuronectes platessa]